MKYIRFAAALSLVFIMLFAAVACTGAEAAAEPDPGDVVNIPEPTHTQAQTGPMASATPANTDEQPEVTPSEPQSPEPAQTPDDGLPYYLYVEKGSFTLTIYEKDEQGEYTKVLAAYRIAHGGNKTPAARIATTAIHAEVFFNEVFFNFIVPPLFLRLFSRYATNCNMQTLFCQTQNIVGRDV